MGIVFFATPLHRVAVEDVVFVARRSSHALQAADDEQGHAHRDQEGNCVFIDRKPVRQVFHRQSPNTTYFRSCAAVWTQRLTYYDAFLGSEFRRVQCLIGNYFRFPLAFRGIKGED